LVRKKHLLFYDKRHDYLAEKVAKKLLKSERSDNLI